ncbi:MAG: glycosyltransferase family 2 protein [Phycisphaerae bacterium]|nr:glycosyltransferase family 2 protein [Phycisphaerae bacterium]
MALPLSISIVCRDNEATLPRVLDSIAGLASEVIALDSGSTDGTISLLRAHGVIVVEQAWLGFVKQKQAALDRCSQPWVLHLDSDESLEPSLRASIESAVARNEPAVAGYEVNRKVWYAGGFLEHAWQPEWRLRLVRRGAARWVGDDPHDALEATSPGTRIERLAGDLRHDSIPSIAEFLEKQARHARTAAESQHARGRRGSVASLVFSPLGEFAKQIISRSAWRDGWRGWVAASASSAAAAMKHACLLERSRRGDDP